jgi:maltose O-acetyltransferase
MIKFLIVRGLFSLHRLIPGNPSNATRNRIKRWLLARLSIEIGAHSQISPGFFVFQRGHFRCGTNCRLGYGFSVWNHAPFSVGDNLLASHGVSVICGTHKTDAARSNISGPVRLGDNVWIGANVLIVGPCTIGDNVIIGANAFVTGDIASGAVIGGSPARELRRSPGAKGEGQP